MKTRLLTLLFLLSIPYFALAQWTTTDLSLARRDIGAGKAGNLVFFAGGRPSNSVDDFALYRNRVDVYNLSTNSWSELQLDIERQFCFAVGVGNKVYFGGYTQVLTPDQDIVEVYDIDTETWSTLEMPSIDGATSMTAEDGKVFFVNDNIVDIYDTTTGSWSTEFLSENRILAYALSCEGRVYFAGGGSFVDGTSATVDVYEIATGQWTVEQLSTGRNQMTGACFKGKAYFVGGALGFDGWTKNIDIYDPATDTWSLLELNAPKSGMGVAATFSNLYIGGGYDNDEFDSVDEVEIIDAAGNKTTDVLSNTRAGVSSIAAGGRVFFAGGSDGFDFQTTVDIFVEEPSSTNEVSVAPLETMPNPVLDELVINLPQNNTDLSLNFYSLTGTLVRSMAAQSSVNVQGLPQGLYLLQLEENGTVIARTKVLKQ